MLLLTLLAPLGSAGTQAGSTLSVGLSPVVSAYDLRAGDSIVIRALVTSGGSQGFHGTVAARDALLHGSNFEYTALGQEFWAAGNWLAIEPAEFDMGPNERRNLTVTVTVPEGTPDGEYYAAFGVLASPDTAAAAADGTVVQFSGSVVSLICIAVGEGQARLARLIPCGDVPQPSSAGKAWGPRLWGTLKHWWLGLVVANRNVAPVAEAQGFQAFAPIENLCDVHIQPRVTATFRREDKTLQQVTVDGEIILPGGKELVEIPWPDAPLYGLYTLDLEVEYGGPEPLQATQSFLILPVKGILGLIAVAFGLGYFVAGRGRTRNKPATPTPPATGLPS